MSTFGQLFHSGETANLNSPRIPQTLAGINTTGLIARWLLDGSLTDQVSGRPLTRAGTWNTVSNDLRWDSELNQYVTIFTGANYLTFDPTGFPSGAAAGTLCCWAKVRATDNGTIVSYGSNTANGSERDLSVFNSNITFNAYNLAVNAGINPLSDGTWHHFAGVYNGATMQVYVDGLLQGSTSATLATTLSGGYIGRWITSNYFFVGGGADVRSYSTALSAAQVLAITQGLA